MQDSDRGGVRNERYATQPRDFKGLRWNNITPTDIDAFIDFGNKVFVFIEAKYKDAHLASGQRLAYERLVDACYEAKKTAVFIVGRHCTEVGIIDYASMIVDEIRFEGKYITLLNKQQTVRQAIDILLNWLDRQHQIRTGTS